MAETRFQAWRNRSNDREAMADPKNLTELLLFLRSRHANEENKQRSAEVYDALVSELNRLPETSGIEDYHRHFNLFRSTVNLPDDALVRAFLAGLSTDFQLNIRMFQPQTVSQCLLIGRLYAQAHPHHKHRETLQEVRSASVGETDSDSFIKPFAHPVPETSKIPAPIEENITSAQTCGESELVSVDLEGRLKTVADEKVNPPFRHNIEHLVVDENQMIPTDPLLSRVFRPPDPPDLNRSDIISPVKLAPVIDIPPFPSHQVLLSYLEPVRNGRSQSRLGMYLGEFRLSHHLAILSAPKGCENNKMIGSSRQYLIASPHNVVFTERFQNGSLRCVNDALYLLKGGCTNNKRPLDPGITPMLRKFSLLENSNEDFGCDNRISLPSFSEGIEIRAGDTIWEHMVILCIDCGAMSSHMSEELAIFNKVPLGILDLIMGLHGLRNVTKRDPSLISIHHVLIAEDDISLEFSRVLKQLPTELTQAGIKWLSSRYSVQQIFLKLPTTFCEYVVHWSSVVCVFYRMKQFADQHRTERELEIGDYVYVKLQPYRQQSVVHRSHQKLSPKYFGPYKVIDRCGKVAYKLELPSSSQIHPVFHISQLKLRIGNVVASSQLPSIVQDVLVKEPERILERKMVNRQGRAATMVLVKWSHQPEEEATWEVLYELTRRYPAFQP